MGIFKLFKNKEDNTNSSNQILSPTNGEILELSEVPDEVFSQKILGDGFAIKSNDGVIVSPVDGTVEMVYNTKHAVGLKTNDNKEILIHLGIDTVKLEGKGFKVFVESGQKIKAGDKLIEMDVDFIKKNAKSDISPVVFTNLDENEQVSISKGEVNRLESDRISIITK